MTGNPAADADADGAAEAIRRPRARAVLLGTGTHVPGSDLPDVASVATTLSDLRQALVERCGLSGDRIRVECDPATPIDPALPESALKGLGSRAFGVYVHVPFCATRCGSPAA